MAKSIYIDGVFYRQRRGQWVVIPSEWLHKTPTKSTKRHRPSRWTGKRKRADRLGRKNIVYLDSKVTPILDE